MSRTAENRGLRAALRRHATPSLVIGVGLVVAITLFGVFVPFVVADPLTISSSGMQPPSAEHWLGTTQTVLGRGRLHAGAGAGARKSTRLTSRHGSISHATLC